MLGIPSHLSELSPTPVVIQHQLDTMVETCELSLRQLHGVKTPLLGRKVHHLLLAAMQDQRSSQAPQLLQLTGAGRLPAFAGSTLPPVPLAIPLFELALIPSNRMIHRRQQGIQLGRATVLHRGSREHPDRPQTGMTGQTQQGGRALRLKRLGVVRFIHHQERSRWWQGVGKPSPTHQLKLNPKGL